MVLVRGNARGSRGARLWLRSCAGSRSAQHPLAHRRGLRRSWAARREAGLDAEPRPAGGRGRALHPGVHHGAGLLGQPLGLHDRHVPDDDRRAQPPLAPRRRLPACPTGVRVLPEWMRDAGYFTANIRTIRPSSALGTGKTDWNFTPPRAALRRRPVGRPEAAPAVLRADQLPRDAPHVSSTARSTRSTRPR